MKKGKLLSIPDTTVTDPEVSLGPDQPTRLPLPNKTSIYNAEVIKYCFCFL